MGPKWAPPRKRPSGGRAEFVATAGWQFAKTMPEIPHWYTVRGQASGDKTVPPPVEWHDWFAYMIQKHGYRDKWGNHWHWYMDFDGFKYWAIWPVINRETLDAPNVWTPELEPAKLLELGKTEVRDAVGRGAREGSTPAVLEARTPPA